VASEFLPSWSQVECLGSELNRLVMVKCLWLPTAVGRDLGSNSVPQDFCIRPWESQLMLQTSKSRGF
jgi:hypothetical protein